jgi:hypothetical protein
MRLRTVLAKGRNDDATEEGQAHCVSAVRERLALKPED